MQQFEYAADTSYISGSSSFSRKFRNCLIVTTAQGNLLNTSLSFEGKETKYYRSLAFIVLFSTHNHEMLFLEELTQQKTVPSELTNHLQVQLQKGQRLTIYSTFQNYSNIVYQINNEILTFSGRTANFTSTFLNTKDHYKATLLLNADSGLFRKKKINYFVEAALKYKTNPEGSSRELVVRQVESPNQNLLFVAVFSTGKQSKQSFQLIFRNSNDPYNKKDFDINGKHFWLDGTYYSMWSFNSTFRQMEQNLTFDPDGIELRYVASSNLILYKNELSTLILNFTSPKTQSRAVSNLTAELRGVHTAKILVQFMKIDNGHDFKGRLNFNVLDSTGQAHIDLSYCDFTRLTSNGTFYWRPPMQKANTMNHALLATSFMRNSSFKIVYNKEGGIHRGSSYMEISGVKPIIVETNLRLTDAKDFANISLRVENGNNPFLKEVALNLNYKINDRSLISMGSLKILPYFNTSSLEISLVKGRVSEAVIKLKTPYELLRSLQFLISFETDFKFSKVIKGSLHHNGNELIGFTLDQYFINNNDFGLTLYIEAFNRRHEPISLNLKYKFKYDGLLLSLALKMAPRLSISSALNNWGTKQFQYSLIVRLNDEVYKGGISISDKLTSEAVEISLTTSNIKVIISWNFNNDNKEVSRVTYQITYDGIFFILSGSYLNQLDEEKVNIHMKIHYLIYRLLIINSRGSAKSKKLDFEIQNQSQISSEMKTCHFGEWSKIHIVLNFNSDLKDQQNISAMFSINSTCTRHFIVFYEFSELNEHGNRKSVHITCPDHGLSGIVVVDSLYVPVLKYDVHLSLDTRPRKKGIEPLGEHYHRSDILAGIIKEQSSETNIVFVTAEWINNQKIRVKVDLTKQNQNAYFHRNSTATSLFLYFDDININTTDNKAKRSSLISGQRSDDRFAVSLENAYFKLIQIHLPYKPSLFVWVKISQVSPKATTLTLSRDISSQDLNKFTKMLIGEMRLEFGAASKILLKFTTPKSTVRVSGTVENPLRDPQGFDATVIYNVGVNNNKKFLMKLNGENGSKMKKLTLSALFPQSKNVSINISSELDLNIINF